VLLLTAFSMKEKNTENLFLRKKKKEKKNLQSLVMVLYHSVEEGNLQIQCIYQREIQSLFALTRKKRHYEECFANEDI